MVIFFTSTEVLTGVLNATLNFDVEIELTVMPVESSPALKALFEFIYTYKSVAVELNNGNLLPDSS
jgi:hypothetical protein